jgi:DNA-binding HxlR family transcriptional regulator
MIVRDAFYGRTKFSEFVKYSGAQATVVSDRLKKLVGNGIFERVLYEEYPARYEYRLTEMGADLAHVLLAMSAWGDRWLDKGAGRPIVITHTKCGHDAGPHVSCSHCGSDLDAIHLRADPGPGFPANRPTIIRRRT